MASQWHLPQRLDFHGREVRYGVRGQGAPLILVHGTPWSSFNLRHLIAGFAADHTVYYYDLLGYGQSDRREGDVSLGIQNRVLDHLLGHWQLEAPAVVGHDFGGATVLRNHLLDARRFRAIILVDPVAVAPWGSPFFRHVREHEAAFAGVPDYIHEAIVRAYVTTAAHQPIAAHVMAAIVAPWTAERGKAAFYRQIAQADSRFTDQVQPLYPEIRVPVLILWGEKDTWIPVDRGRELHRLIPGSRFETIPDAGHLVIEEKPEALVRHMREFLQRIEE